MEIINPGTELSLDPMIEIRGLRLLFGHMPSSAPAGLPLRQPVAHSTDPLLSIDGDPALRGVCAALSHAPAAT